MTAPTLTALGERLRDRTGPLAPDDPAYGYAHAHLSQALNLMIDQVGAVFDPDGDVPPGAPLLDPALCPDFALPWLAQIVGVQLPAGLPASDWRELIAQLGRYHTGTPAALASAAAFALTGTKTVYFRERYGGDAYVLEIVTLSSETPDPAAVLALLLAQKPGGIVLDYHQVSGWDYDAMTAAGGTYTTLQTHYATYNDLRDNTRTG